MPRLATPLSIAARATAADTSVSNRLSPGLGRMYSFPKVNVRPYCFSISLLAGNCAIAAMAFAAAESILSYFEESGENPFSFDYIVTGDLGKVGSDILKEILSKKIPGAERLHSDCGLLLYDMKKQDVHSGASGCGTSASVLASHFLPLLDCGMLKNVLFLSTGALMSPQSLLQGETILGIAPIIRLESMKGD
jgi:stage V sporulation protein AD